MAKIIDRLKEQLTENILTETEIDQIMEREKYYPSENDMDDESEEGILKYSNGKSEMWVKCIYSDGEYIVSDVTLKTKKSGSTRTRHLTPEEIKKIMDYFRNNGKYDEFLIFLMELFLARRIGDTLCLEWRHFYYENGNKRDVIRDLLEQKTDKTAKLHIANVIWKYLDWYCTAKGISPMEHYGEDIFNHTCKENIPKYIGSKVYTHEYEKAIKTQAKAFRYQFNCAAKALGIEGVSTHSIRKTFGRLAHDLNQFDPDCLDVLQSIYVHDSRETTKIYIDIIDEKAKCMFNGVADFISDVDEGKEPCIQNTPVIGIKTNDLRDILLRAYNMGMENSSVQNANVHMKNMNLLLSEMEKMRV